MPAKRYEALLKDLLKRTDLPRKAGAIGESLRSLASPTPDIQPRQFLVVLRGPAGAGKSTLARAIQRAIKTKTAVIDTDIFNWQIRPGEDNKTVVYDNVAVITANYLRYGYNVIVEGLIITTEERGGIQRLRGLAALHRAIFLDFYCWVPLETALQRNRLRDKNVPSASIEEWWQLAEADKRRVSWPLIEVDMTDDTEHSVTRVLGRLRAL